MKRYSKYIKPYLSAFILGPVLMVVEVVGEVFLPALMANIINIGAANNDILYIVRTGMVMAVITCFMMVSGIGGAYFASKAAVNFAADLRKDTFRKVQQFSFNNIDQFSTGSLVTRLTNDITQLQNVIMMGLRMLLRAPGMLIGAIVMAFFMNAELATILLIVLPCMIVAIGIIIKTAFPRFEKMQKKLDQVNSKIQETLTNVRVIKSFVRGTYEEEQFANANAELKDSSLSAFKVVIFSMPLVMFFMNFTTLAVVWFGGNQILEGRMPVGNLTAFTTYVVQVLFSLMMLAMVLLQSSRAVASARRINEVLDTSIDISDEKAKCPDAIVTKGKITFKNVSFRYYKDSKEKVLDQIDFTIEAGDTVGIIGSTGSGKTTMVSLIPRLYDTDEGEVLIDDINVRDYSLYHLRNGVGMVLQKNILFSGSVKENLEWGNSEAEYDEIVRAAKEAQADDFLNAFSEGYETELGQGGINVSGGQKQRLCIARALLKKPKILILDDSTSAVDTATEAKIRESFQGTLKETTKIIIAQRISSVIQANKIVVLDDGQVVGIGTHEKLLLDCTPYQEIYYSQMDKEVLA